MCNQIWKVLVSECNGWLETIICGRMCLIVYNHFLVPKTTYQFGYLQWNCFINVHHTFQFQIQTQSLQLDNVTITEVSIQPAVVPPPPEPPVIPPEYNTTVEAPVTPVEVYDPVKSGDSNGSKLSIFTPHRIVLTHYPPKEVLLYSSRNPLPTEC